MHDELSQRPTDPLGDLSTDIPHSEGGTPLGDHDVPALEPFPIIRGYRIRRCISVGGQGEIYEAVQETTGGQVAIKVLKKKYCNSAEAKRKLADEIRLLVRLRHPNIVSVFDAGETGDGRLFYIMEYCAGLSLREFVRSRKPRLAPLLRLFQTICQALQFVHKNGIVHRDLKPANILVDSHGAPKIIDFGLARALIAPEDMSEHQVVGTLPYMSPEQTRGLAEEIDDRSDLYSLGVILYEMVIGQLPYPVSGSLTEIFERITLEPPTQPRRCWTPQLGIAAAEGNFAYECPIDFELEAILLKTLAKAKEARYSSARDLADNISRYLTGQPVNPLNQRVTYVLFSQFRLFVYNHRITAFLMAGLAAFSLAESVGVVHLIYLWTPLNSLYERVSSRWLSPAPRGTPFEDIRVIGRTDSTDFAELAAESGVSLDPSDMKSARRLHGLLMKKLSKSKCRVVVWDYAFEDASDYDQDFVSGAQELLDNRIDIVIGALDWWLAQDAEPKLSPSIAAVVKKHGCVQARFNEQEPWLIPLAAFREGGQTVPNLSLLGTCAFYHPLKYPDVRLDVAKRVVDIGYWENGVRDRHSRTRIILSKPQVIENDPAEIAAGFLPGDTLGYFQFNVPPQGVLDDSTIAYERVFDMSEAAIEETFQGKVIVVGDLLKESPDRFGHPDRGVLAGCYGHAACIDALLRGQVVSTPSRAAELLLSILGAVAGCATSLFLFQQSLRRILALCVWTMILFIVSLGVYSNVQCLWNPLVAMTGLWVGAEGYAGVRRVELRFRRRWMF